MDKQDHSRAPKMETTLIQLDARVGRIESDVARIQSDLAHVQSDVSELKSEMKDMRGLLIQVLQALAKIDGRMDEQRQTLNALIPTRLAAVGER
jgi:predicted  nucleic acid-binding Zn-ribbon protein